MKNTPVMAAVLFLFMSLPVNAQNNIPQNNTSQNNTSQDNTTGSNVTRALFTTGLEDREPIDEIGQLEITVPRVFFFTEITGMANQTITHRWQYEGKIKATIKLKIGGDRWRVWSSKKLMPQWVGIWTVTVLDANDNILAEEDMVYIPAGTTNQTPAQ